MNNKAALHDYQSVIISFLKTLMSAEEKNRGRNLYVENLLNIEIFLASKKTQARNNDPAATLAVSNDVIHGSSTAPWGLVQ
ncbi:MAG: hypothetical protein ACU83U_04330 [Gammaproteobacteria bacterium]